MAVTLDFFPRARRDRATPGGIFDPLANAPRTHLFPFSFSASSGVRSARSAGPFRSPGLIRRIEWRFGSMPADDVAIGFLEVGYARQLIEETNVGTGVTPAWTRIGEVLSGNTVQHPLDRPGLSQVRGPAPGQTGPLDLDFLVLQDGWFVVVSFWATNFLVAVHGTLTVVEGLSPEAVLNFL